VSVSRSNSRRLGRWKPFHSMMWCPFADGPADRASRPAS